MFLGNIKNVGIVTAATIMLMSGCATTELQTKSKLTRSVILDHSKAEKKVIYLQVTNTAGSGGENMELLQDIKNKLKAKGYTISDSSKGASYGLFVNVLFANNLKEANAIKAGVSALTLGAGGALMSGAGGRDSLIVGAVFALGAATIGKALEDEIFRAVVDVSIRDYTTKNVNTITSTTDVGAHTFNVRRGGNLDSLAGPIGEKTATGDMNSGIAQNVTTSTVKDYEEHKTRVFCEAVKMHLKTDEALPILQEKISKQITNLF